MPLMGNDWENFDKCATSVIRVGKTMMNSIVCFAVVLIIAMKAQTAFKPCLTLVCTFSLSVFTFVDNNGSYVHT